MTDRASLIEFILNTPCVAISSRYAAEHIADNLIANGVTVNEWRPASEPPKEDGEYLVFYSNGKYSWQAVCKFTTNLEKIHEFDFAGRNRPGWYKYDGEYGYYEFTSVTHWMPLPLPPKGDPNE
jgi:hypothetical protein